MGARWWCLHRLPDFGSGVQMRSLRSKVSAGSLRAGIAREEERAQERGASVSSPFVHFFFFLATPGIWSYWARDQIRATVVTYTAAVATPNPLTPCAGPGIEPVSWRCRDAANPVVPQRELLFCFFISSENISRAFTQGYRGDLAAEGHFLGAHDERGRQVLIKVNPQTIAK